MEKNQKPAITAVWFLLIISIGVILFSGYKLWGSLQSYAQGNENYEQLHEQVRQPDENHVDSNMAVLGSAPMVDISPIYINFNVLEKINSDAAAWLYCPNTVIDYPIMRADDYDWYLHHLPDGTYNANGTLFLDYNCPADFSGRLSIIYGHYMKSGKMFGSLAGYKKQEYFERHPYLYLYTRQGNYRIDLKYGCVIGAGEWRDRAFMYEVNLNALLAYAASKTTFDSSAECTDGDKFIILSTCSYEFNDARYIVIGVLRPEYGAG
ncbi:class B sortase [Desulforamulus aeronauticus]|uniref:Sortase B n=1 Tax=Desulforamulus aeronauticus DSM 10349 TaxID=1121421 RepID=A0A1M6VSU6_9FIRM|nr:class B sortase [Desulforamulus aeronauticus]SHK84577.1 sortase B [Desulforamulus aeronauticus DSM 10349]